jgi:hypothetical protein
LSKRTIRFPAGRWRSGRSRHTAHGTAEASSCCTSADAPDVVSVEIRGPKATSDLDRANVSALEGAIAAMGGHAGGCSRLTTVVVPTGPGTKPSRLKLRTRARAVDGRTDVDRLTLECRK